MYICVYTYVYGVYVCGEYILYQRCEYILYERHPRIVCIGLPSNSVGDAFAAAADTERAT